MLSKNKINQIQALAAKKERDATHLFVVEGTKSVAELLRSKIHVKSLFATPEWLSEHEVIQQKGVEITEVSEKELIRASLLTTPQQVIALAEIPDTPELSDKPEALVIVLDSIQDPGNLGTIIRIADWYGIPYIVCSEQCADMYNPKVIQATMGSFTRVSCIRTDLNIFFEKNTLPVYGAMMSGKSVYETSISKTGILLIGNEGSGIHPDLQPFITQPLSIPRRGGAESLNAGIATAILCDAWARGVM